MKILAINGSRRKSGNTAILIQSILEPARKAGTPVETIHLGDLDIAACTGCEGCSGSWACVIEDDFPISWRFLPSHSQERVRIQVLFSPRFLDLWNLLWIHVPLKV